MNRKAGLGYTVPLALFMFILIITVAFTSVLFMKSVDFGIRSRTLDMAVSLSRNEAEMIKAGINRTGVTFYDENFLETDEDNAVFLLKVEEEGTILKNSHISVESKDGSVIYELDFTLFEGGMSYGKE
ncbi:MAG: hypothetical protein MJ171_05815 [Clostridia bacterium]|nr:hypothetical protein [Clostridia bacterium]